ncbi:MAG: hypothetical protein LIP10_12100 [Clostridiales bacterium]|nr:hypothetical protein [Clostridiales bacterium]
MIVGLDFLDSIREKMICVCDGYKIEFACGEAAKTFLINEADIYSVKNIRIEEGIIVAVLNRKSKQGNNLMS